MALCLKVSLQQFKTFMTQSLADNLIARQYKQKFLQQAEIFIVAQVLNNLIVCKQSS